MKKPCFDFSFILGKHCRNVDIYEIYTTPEIKA